MSDVDILIIPMEGQRRQDYPHSWSVYSPELISSYYRSGRLFAWHLHREAKCLYSPNSNNVLAQLGAPSEYTSMKEDIFDLETLLLEAVAQIRDGTSNLVYELGIVHTAIRDIAMSASWRLLGLPVFSRDAPYRLPIQCPLPQDIYQALLSARHSSTRGAVLRIDSEIVAQVVLATPFSHWISQIRSHL